MGFSVSVLLVTCDNLAACCCAEEGGGGEEEASEEPPGAGQAEPQPPHGAQEFQFLGAEERRRQGDTQVQFSPCTMHHAPCTAAKLLCNEACPAAVYLSVL
jgi:hypothetical protein